MATNVPQRMLRNQTAALLRRVQAGERLRITVHGHPVADLVPLERSAQPTSVAAFRREAVGVLASGDDWAAEVRRIRDEDDYRDPFEDA